MSTSAAATHTSGRGAGRAAAVAASGVACFWIGSLSAGALASDYSATQDYVSSLASRGSSVAALGIGAIAASAVAHAGGALAHRRGWGGRAVPGALAGSAISLVAVAAFRQNCPGGAAGCSGPDSPPDDWIDTAHAVSVVGYQVFFVVALVAFGVRAVRRRGDAAPDVPPVLGPASLGLAVLSTGLLLRSLGESDPGAWQRGWVAVGQAWLVGTSVLAARRATHPG